MACDNSSAPRPELFWPKVQWTRDGCWEWGASRHRNGYGQFHLPGKRHALAHRASWLLLFGPIPDGLHVLHRCDNRPCVRPDHLFLGTRVDNMQDMAAKGRRGRTGPKPSPRCGRGHEPNWYVNPNSGSRLCRDCRAEWLRAYRLKKKVEAA
ncbi:HNH endonuclease signature motif containing protein [Streptomyces sp. NPDC001705]